jgi:hypothetical protein
MNLFCWPGHLGRKPLKSLAKKTHWIVMYIERRERPQSGAAAQEGAWYV